MEFDEDHSLELSQLTGPKTRVVGDFTYKTYKPPYFPMKLCYFSRTTTSSIPGSCLISGKVGLIRLI